MSYGHLKRAARRMSTVWSTDKNLTEAIQELDRAIEHDDSMEPKRWTVVIDTEFEIAKNGNNSVAVYVKALNVLHAVDMAYEKLEKHEVFKDEKYPSEGFKTCAVFHGWHDDLWSEPI
jgi:hypothetical protein